LLKNFLANYSGMKKNITFVFFTYNEEKRIGYAVRNVMNYGDVILMDAGSTDKTKEIAEGLGATYYLRPDNSKPQVETQKNFDFIKEHISTDWVYWGYVDNFVPKSLLEKLQELSLQDIYKLVKIPLYTYLWGNTDHVIQEAYSPFFYHKDFMDYKENYIHGMGQFQGSAEQILVLPNKKKYALLHFSTYNITKFIQGHLRYAETEAQEKFARGERFSLIKMLAAIVRYWWIYRKSLRTGSLGVIILMSYAAFRTMSYARLYELEHGITLDSIEQAYSQKKEELLKIFDA